MIYNNLSERLLVSKKINRSNNAETLLIVTCGYVDFMDLDVVFKRIKNSIKKCKEKLDVCLVYETGISLYDGCGQFSNIAEKNGWSYYSYVVKNGTASLPYLSQALVDVIKDFPNAKKIIKQDSDVLIPQSMYSELIKCYDDNSIIRPFVFNSGNMSKEEEAATLFFNKYKNMSVENLPTDDYVVDKYLIINLIEASRETFIEALNIATNTDWSDGMYNIDELSFNKLNKKVVHIPVPAWHLASCRQKELLGSYYFKSLYGKSNLVK